MAFPRRGRVLIARKERRRSHSNMASMKAKPASKTAARAGAKPAAKPAAKTAAKTAANAAAHKPPPLRRKGAARVIAEAGFADEAIVVERPDGWYWCAPDGSSEFGPFVSGADARADRDRYNEEAPSEGETLREAEAELGIADWIDAETGAPAEGQSPHLEER